jgi:hypothetical protein
VTTAPRLLDETCGDGAVAIYAHVAFRKRLLQTLRATSLDFSKDRPRGEIEGRV